MIPRFDKPLDLRKVVEKQKKKFLWMIPYESTRDYWIVLTEFRLIFGDGENDFFTIPVGFKTDLASVPKPLRGLIGNDGAFTQPAVGHDRMYDLRGKYNPNLPPLSRGSCDIIFREIMKNYNVGLAERRAIWRAVDMFGWIYWNKPRG